MLILTGFIATIYAAIHILSDRLALSQLSKPAWRSAAGGAAIAYVFLHILPELQTEHSGQLLPYIFALFGLCFFYVADQLIARRETGRGDQGHLRIVQVAGYAAINFIIGYLLIAQPGASALSVLLYAAAIGFHFLTNDRSLKQANAILYHSVGRYILVISVIAGWLTALLTRVDTFLLHSAFAFLAGSVIANVMREDFPNAAESRLFAFVGGVGLYAAILVIAHSLSLKGEL